MLVIFATALLRRMPNPNRVVAIMPYWSALGRARNLTFI